MRAQTQESRRSVDISSTSDAPTYVVICSSSTASVRGGPAWLMRDCSYSIATGAARARLPRVAWPTRHGTVGSTSARSAGRVVAAVVGLDHHAVRLVFVVQRGGAAHRGRRGAAVLLGVEDVAAGAAVAVHLLQRVRAAGDGESGQIRGVRSGDRRVDGYDKTVERRDRGPREAESLDLEHPLLPQRALDVLKEDAVKFLAAQAGAAVLGVQLGKRRAGEVGPVVLGAAGGQDDGGAGPAADVPLALVPRKGQEFRPRPRPPPLRRSRRPASPHSPHRRSKGPSG